MKKKIKKIVFISGSRSEFFIIKNLFEESKKHFDVKIIIHAGNTQNIYGNLSKNILTNKKNYIEKFKSNYGEANKISEILKGFSTQIVKLGSKLKAIKPSIVILTGDRTETLAAACAAVISSIPIAHIHGGELSFGSLDERLRHAISKLSDLHFVAHDKYKKRLMQLGENKKKIKVIGSPSLSNFDQRKFKESYFIEKYNLYPKKFILVTLNSSLDEKETIFSSKKLFRELDKLPFIKVVTYPNPDLHNQHIIRIIKKRKNKKTYKIFKFIGEDYPYFIKYCKFMIGNSSSGIIEAPYFNTYVINIGSRQEGRLFSKKTTLNLNNLKKLNHILKISFYSKKKYNSKNLYYKKNSSKLFVNVLKQIDLRNLKVKKFFDIKYA